MPKYIELEQAIDLFYPEDPENDGFDGCTTVLKSGNYTSAEIESMLSNLPVADVAPVVHGKWREVTRSVYCGMDKQGNPIYRDRSVYYCSECNRKTVIKEKYCPDCSAKMDLEEDK